MFRFRYRRYVFFQNDGLECLGGMGRQVFFTNVVKIWTGRDAEMEMRLNFRIN